MLFFFAEKKENKTIVFFKIIKLKYKYGQARL